MTGWQRALIYGLLVVGLMVNWYGPHPGAWPREAVFATLALAFVAAIATEILIWMVEGVLR